MLIFDYICDNLFIEEEEEIEQDDFQDDNYSLL